MWCPRIATIVVVCCCLVAFVTGADVVRRKKKKVDPYKYLEKFGYLDHLPKGRSHDFAAASHAIRRFQRMTGLPQTGSVDAATRKKMKQPRCGMPDTTPVGYRMPLGALKDPRQNPNNYHVPGYVWTNPKLRWRTVNYSPDLPPEAQRRTLHEAFQKWSDVADLEFSEVGSAPQDIEIKFEAGDHGDGGRNAFDGAGGTLAHAYYPENGDTHFDEDERWTLGTSNGINLLVVATHELGHALGLGHSEIPTAVMAPYYQGYDPQFKLEEDDIRAIRSLYGEQKNPRTTTSTLPTDDDGPTPTPRTPTQKPTKKPKKPSTKPDDCTTKFDAVLLGHDDNVYIFRKRWIYRVRDDGVEKGFPRMSRKIYDRPPIYPGAAVYSWRTQYTYIFKGRKVYKYYGFRRITKKRVRSPGYPRNVQAALMGRDARIYIMMNGSYWIFDEYTMDVSGRAPQPIKTMWPGIPDVIDAAERHPDGNLYFITGKKYYKFYEITRRVIAGYPKYKAGPWMGHKCMKKTQPLKCNTLFCINEINSYIEQSSQIVPK